MSGTSDGREEGTTPKKKTQLPVLPIVTAVLASTRPIPVGDRLFSVLYPMYVYLVNRFRFDRNAPVIAADRPELPLLREGGGQWFKIYILTFGVIGLILPLVLQSISPRSVADAAAPHLYLTLCQVCMETVTNKGRYHPVPRLMVPIGFNAFRLAALRTWLRTAWRSWGVAGAAAPSRHFVSWETVGLVMAVANAVAWTYNLFVFLLLRTLPQYLDRRKFPEAEVSWKGQLLPILERKGTLEKI